MSNTMSNPINIEWTGKSYTEQIENLSEALDAAAAHIERKGHKPEPLYAGILKARNGEAEEEVAAIDLWADAETAFAKIAFKEWMVWPDGWTLTA